MIRESIMVMNSKTYEMFKLKAIESASQQSDPIQYISNWGNLHVEVDNSLEDDIVEVWYKVDYDNYKGGDK